MLLCNPVSGLTALYDTCADEGQTRNLAADKPDLVRTLAGQIEDYSRSLPGYPTRPKPLKSHRRLAIAECRVLI
ncbi:MAG: hypothetical protein ACYTFI_07295 [Planctomycetota bacterium]